MKNLLRLLLCLIILFQTVMASFADDDSFSILDEALWKVSFTFYLENPSGSERDCELTLPVVPSDYPAQQVISREFPGKPLRLEKDLNGNEMGTWKIKLNAEERGLLVFSYIIRTSHIRWNVPDYGKWNVPDNGIKKVPAVRTAEKNSYSPRPRPLIIAVQTVTADEKNPFYKSLSLYDFIISHYRFESGERPPGEIVLSMKPTVQCSGAALLLAEMLKESGIPSRYVGGLYVSPGREIYNEFHAWTELRLPGCPWTDADTTLGRFDLGNRLRCFLERRTGYITLWKGYREPFSLLCKEDGPIKTGFSFSINVNRIKDTTCNRSAEKPADLDRYYRALTPPRRMLWKSSDSPQAIEHYNRGKKYEAEKASDKAREQYYKALILSPGYIDPVNGLLHLCESASERAVIYPVLKKKAQASKKDVLAWYALGEMESKLNHRSAAAEAYQNADLAGFTCEDLYLSKMRLYGGSKEVKPFERAFCVCLTVNGRSYDAYKKALLFFQDLELWERCIYWCRKGKKEIASSSLFPGVEGFALMQKGELDKARRSIDEAIAIDPGMGWYYCIRGWIQLRQGDRAGAQQSIEKGISLGKGVQNPAFFRSLLKGPVR
ncbi:MAG: transglutaminase domain-containing protein [Vulcanimicrobiota bacterium]